MKFKIMEVHEKAQSEKCIPSNYTVTLTNTLNEILEKKQNVSCAQIVLVYFCSM